MSLTKVDLANEVWDAGLVTLCAVVLSVVSKRVFKDGPSVPSTPQGVLKLVAAVTGGSLVVQYLQKSKYLPDDPFTKAS